jgi:ubiquinone/menaquinone biosynthesis C-methylase UbiE
MFQLYGLLGEKVTDDTLAVCRTTYQKFSLPFMINEVAMKLKLNESDVLLELGCGTGTLLFPLALKVKSVVGIDHKGMIDRLRKSPLMDNCTLLDGNWLEDKFDLPKVNKILIYSVIHYMKSLEEALDFISKALDLLKPGGMLLVGDIPNMDKKQRFSTSEIGKQFQEQWNKERQKFRTEEEIKRDEYLSGVTKRNDENSLTYGQDEEVLSFDFTDEMVAQAILYIRKLGNEAYLLPQDKSLPFGYTRDDLLIIKG